jgi:hypothetical protein
MVLLRSQESRSAFSRPWSSASDICTSIVDPIARRDGSTALMERSYTRPGLQSSPMHSPHARRRLGVLVLIAVVAGAVPVWPQTRSLPEAPGTWKPWKPFAASAGARQEQSATAALVKAFENELLALNAILRRAAAVASPVGFSVETWGNLAGYHAAEYAPGQPAATALPLAGGLTFGAFPIFEYERNGKTIREDTGETALQQFLVNQIGASVFDSRHVLEWGPVDHDAFLQPLPLGEIAGLPRYGDSLVIARDPAALWTPLSQRGALDLVVKARELEVQNAQQSVDTFTARLAEVRDPAWRAKRLKEAQEAAAAMPNPQAFVKQIEESLQIEEASLVKEVGPAAGAGKVLTDATRALREVTDLIAALPPAELATPACYAVKGATLRDKFRTVASAECQALVRPNYGYFSKTVPRSTPQVVIIRPIARCFDTADKFNRDANSPSPAGCRANRGLIETIDKQALRAWLR